MPSLKGLFHGLLFIFCEKLPVSKYFSFIAGVIDTVSNIFANIGKNSKWSHWNIQGPEGK
jgi:hypothetical protein